MGHCYAVLCLVEFLSLFGVAWKIKELCSASKEAPLVTLRDAVK